jgi:hypothetical protein
MSRQSEPGQRHVTPIRCKAELGFESADRRHLRAAYRRHPAETADTDTDNVLADLTDSIRGELK